MGKRTRSALLAILTIIGITSSGAFAAPASAKAAEVLQLMPLSIQSSGSITARVNNLDDVYVWDASTTKQTPAIITGGAISPSYYSSGMLMAPRTESSSDGKFLLNLQSTGTHPYTQLNLVDTGNPKTVHPIAETRNISSVPKISPDGLYYAFVGKTDPNNYYQGQSLWTLDLNEYVWDLALGFLQPTGYYLKAIHEGNQPPPNPTYYTYPDALGAFAWSYDSQKLAYILTAYDSARYSYGPTSLKIHDRNTGKSEDLTSLANAMKLEWPQGDYIYYASSSANSSGYYTYQAFRLDTAKKTSESVVADSLDPYTLTVASTGKFLGYSPYTAPTYPPTNTAPKPAVLYDIENKKSIVLDGVASFIFNPAGDQLIMQRLDNDRNAPSKPFWKASVADVVSAAVSGKSDVTKLSKKSEAGQAILSYEPPTDAAEFNTQFTFDPPTFNLSGTYFYSTFNMKNVSSDYYKFNFNSYTTARCKLYDDKGVEIGNNTASIYPLPTGYENKMTMGPKRTSPMYCSGSISGTTTYGTKGKLVLELLGYETGSHTEIEVTF